MHKDNISYHINELKDGEKFAVLPHEQLVLIAQMAQSVESNIKVLNEMLETFGIKKWTYSKDVKTLADIPEMKIGFSNKEYEPKQN